MSRGFIQGPQAAEHHYIEWLWSLSGVDHVPLVSHGSSGQYGPLLARFFGPVAPEKSQWSESPLAFRGQPKYLKSKRSFAKVAACATVRTSGGQGTAPN